MIGIDFLMHISGLSRGSFKKDLNIATFYQNKSDAINHIYSMLDMGICGSCKEKIFEECKS
jgi:hypothetical protein